MTKSEKIAIIVNTVDRPNLFKTVLEKNLHNSGMPFGDIGLFININHNSPENRLASDYFSREFSFYYCWSNIYKENPGNPAALNGMLRTIQSIDTDRSHFGYIAILGDDIELPPYWLSDAIKKSKSMINPGLIGYSWIEKPNGFINEKINIGKYDLENKVFHAKYIFGSWIMPRRVFETLGYFIEFSKYGHWDSEYNDRAREAGFYNFYMTRRSKHVGRDTEILNREFKTREGKKAIERYKQWKQQNKGLVHISWENRRFQ